MALSLSLSQNFYENSGHYFGHGSCCIISKTCNDNKNNENDMIQPLFLLTQNSQTIPHPLPDLLLSCCYIQKLQKPTKLQKPHPKKNKRLKSLAVVYTQKKKKKPTTSQIFNKIIITTACISFSKQSPSQAKCSAK
jgi:hypothetical protein